MTAVPIAGSVVAVTGGLGFIGARLVERLSARGARRIVVLDARADVGAIRLGDDGVERVQEALEGASALFHLAAEKHSESGDRPGELLKTNVLGTHVLFEAARRAGVRKTVFASSLYAYGRVRGAPLVETEPERPATVYGISKLAGEHLGLHVADRGGPAFVALRYFFTYGPRQRSLHGRPSLLVRTFQRLARGEPPVLKGDGAQVLDYVYVDDVVDATVLAMTSGAAGVTLNVGSGAAVPVRDVVERMQRIAGTSFPVVHEPADETAGTRRVASIEKAREVLGWEPRVSLEEGLDATWRWMRDEALGS